MQKPPELMSYLNIHYYLQDLYTYRKQADPKFSYESWARELGIRNRTYVRLIVLGKRPVSEKFLSGLQKSLSLNLSERDFLILLSNYSQTKDPQQREIYGRRLMALIRQDLPQKELEPSDALMDPTTLRLHLLLSYEDIRRDLSTLARMLAQPTSKIEKALEDLLKLGLCEKFDADGALQWRSLCPQVRVQSKPKNEALTQFHNISLNEAIRAQDLPSEIRKYLSFLTALDEKQFVELMSDLQFFMRAQLAKYDRTTFDQSRLYQINLNLIPVSFGSSSADSAGSGADSALSLR